MSMQVSRKQLRAVIFVLALTVGAYGCFSHAAAALPKDRAYEMVSPLFKDGYGALRIEAVAPTGMRIAFYSPGALFATAPSGAEQFDYAANRGAKGWSTEPFMAPAAALPDVIDRDVSSNLDYTIATGKPGPNSEDAYQNGIQQDVLLRSSAPGGNDTNWTSPGVTFKAIDEAPFNMAYLGGSADLCHLFFGVSDSALLPEAIEASEQGGQIYELDRGCSGGLAATRLLGLNNSHKLANPACRSGLGSAEYSEGAVTSTFNAVAAGGSEVFFELGIGVGCSRHQLFVRLGGAKTLEVSRQLEAGEFDGCVGESGGIPGEVPCAGAASRESASFVGASEDGSKVFFTSKAPLLGEVTSTNRLYLASLGCPQIDPGCQPTDKEVTGLIDISSDPNAGGVSDVQGAVRVAPNGSHVYFVARGDLLGAAKQLSLEEEGRSVPLIGADNLYLYETNGDVKFIADLCSSHEESGAVEDRACPSGLDTNTNDVQLWHFGGDVQTNTCQSQSESCDPGRFLAFTTYARLAASDTDNARDVYRYDSGSERLVRVSGGEDGYHANGNCEGSDSKGECDAAITEGKWGFSVRFQYEMGNRAMSEDGSRIVFRTDEPLSPGDSNGQANVYEWRESGGTEGAISLISSGSGEAVEDLVIAPEGGDIFFVSTDGLVAQDTDGAPDIYDARVNGGFPQLPTGETPCKGDACQGPLSNPAPLFVPASVSQPGGGNLPPPRVVSKKTRAKSAHKRRANRRPKGKGTKRVGRQGRHRTATRGRKGR